MMAIQISVSTTDAEEEMVDEVSEHVQSEICEQEHEKKMCHLWLTLECQNQEQKRRKCRKTVVSVSASAMLHCFIANTDIYSQVKSSQAKEESGKS